MKTVKSIILKSKKTLVILLFFVLILLSYRSAFNKERSIFNGAEGSFEAPVTKVIDGDTILLEGDEKVRYIGIDTPEFGSPIFMEAKERNTSLVQGKRVRLELCKEERRDKYGRLLALVYVDGIMVNREMLKEGLARAMIIPPCGLKVREEFNSYELEARQKGIGIWAGDPGTISHREAGRFLGEVKSVTGKVLSIYNSGKAVFLNFGEDYKTDFTTLIFSKDLANFKRVGIDPEVYYRNKEVIVRGRIKEFNGPEIIVREPGQIEIVNE